MGNVLREFHRPRLWLALWGVLIAGVIGVSLVPARDLPSSLFFHGFDKVEHAVGYAVLSLYAGMLFAQRRAQALAAIGLVLLGIGMEIAQAMFTDSRSAELQDALAGAFGVLAGWLPAGTRWALALQRLDARMAK